MHKPLRNTLVDGLAIDNFKCEHAWLSRESAFSGALDDILTYAKPYCCHSTRSPGYWTEEFTMNWNELRKAEFPVSQQWAYFDHAAVAPLPRRSAERLRTWIDDQEANGVVNWPQWEARVEQTRLDVARLIHASPVEIAFVSSTTQGIGLIAEGFPWVPGDNVVTASDEYPSNVYPWMNLRDRGVELRMVPSRAGRILPEDLVAAIDGRTRVLAISLVEFATGFRNDLDQLAELCHERGVALFVDAIQGLGPLVVNVRKTPIDFLCASGQKWLLGPEGAGLLYVRQDWIERLRPLGVGSHSVTSSYNSPLLDFALKPNAQRWEGGCFAMPALQAFGASLSLLLEIGPEAVSKRILEQAESVRELARKLGWTVAGSQRPEEQGGIVAIEKAGILPDDVARRGREVQVVLSSPGLLTVSVWRL